MRFYYWCLLKSSVRLHLSFVDVVMNIVLVFALLVCVFNKELSAHVLNMEGFDRRWALVPLFVLFAYAVLRANYEKVDSLQREVVRIAAAAAHVGLRAEWPGSDKPITYRLDVDGPDSQGGTVLLPPIELHVEGAEILRLEGLTAWVEVDFDGAKVPGALWVVDSDRRSVWAAHDAAELGAPVDLHWSNEIGGVRSLEGPDGVVPVLRAGVPTKLPVLGVRVNNARAAVALFARSGGIAHWRWRLAARTDRGLFEMEVSTPLVLTNTPDPEDAPDIES